MTHRVALYTAIYGQYDELHEYPAIPGVDFYCFTDDPMLYLERDDWTMLLETTLLPPRRAAKWPKILAPESVFSDYDYTIWIDGSHRIKMDFIEEAISYARESGFALHRHPWRDCIYEEAEASVVLPKYKDQPVREQVEHYRGLGYPSHAGLWACGSMVRGRSEAVDRLMRVWWEHITAWSVQDQLSLPVACWEVGLRPSEFPYFQLRNPWFDLVPHSDGST